MKSLANAAVTLALAIAAICIALREAAREHHLKRKLGRHYEGPADGW